MKQLTVALVIFFLVRSLCCFEVQDYVRMQKRMVFYQRKTYGCGISRCVLGSSEEQKKYRSTRLKFYYVTEKNWLEIFSVEISLPVTIEEKEDSVKINHWKVTGSGIYGQLEKTFEKETAGAVICYLPLNAIRFDDALAWCKQNGNIKCFQLKPTSVSVFLKETKEEEKAAELLKEGNEDAVYVIETQDGLWTKWNFETRAEKVKSLMYPGAGLIIPSGGYAPIFYNAAREIETGGRVTLNLHLALIKEEKEIPEKKSASLSLFDTHAHITSSTDLQDAVLMARKYGYKFGLLSILYDEKPYGRFFAGDQDMFEVVKRYGDVFVGLGLVQLNEHGYPGFPRNGPDTPEHIQKLWEKGCQGVKIMEKWSNVDVADSRFDALYQKMVELGLPVVFHTNQEGSGCANSRVAEVAKKFPDLTVVVAHLYDENQLETTIQAMKKYPNLYLQHMHVRSIDWWKKLVQANLAAQILFGSDIQEDYPALMAATAKLVEELRKAGFTESQIEAILFKNAEKIFSKVRVKP